eukprot:TRINITY_DN14562_c0_g1_i1.p1 TRINITY_DN14562_c0_g1~~TRINITY_DN14562_c0_g1_i1.p1  ORF type:complete len:337 (+),score=53.56 TRINITY_DN14562_c0_g1_i1:444-1454(+)
MQSISIDEDKMIPEFSMYKKYMCAVKYRKAVITVIAANRLSKKLTKETRYGTQIPKYIPHAVLQAGSRLTSMISHLAIIEGSFPKRLMTSVIAKAVENMHKADNATGELNVVIESLDEMWRYDFKSKGRESGGGLTKDCTMLVFLAEGLAKLKSKYSWMHLGVPLEHALDDPLNVGGNKDSIVNCVKKIEGELVKLKDIEQLKSKLEIHKDREEALMKQLTAMQAQSKDYEGNIERLVDELKVKENTMVAVDKYESLIHELEAKARNMSSLTSEIVAFALKWVELSEESVRPLAECISDSGKKAERCRRHYSSQQQEKCCRSAAEAMPHKGNGERA